MRHPSRLRWGILSTGRIAGIFARAVAASPAAGWLAAVASRSEESARRFAAEHGIPRAHATYASLVDDDHVQAVYVATPHPHHLEWAVRAAEAGKHVLCEKPAGMNRDEAARMVSAARASGVVFMEAFMYRFHPLTLRAMDLIREGAIGDVQLLQASFSFNSPFAEGSRLWNRDLGGGAILDVGCYPVSWARLVAGAASGKPFADPVKVHGAAHWEPRTGVDAVSTAILEFEGRFIAQVSCGVGLAQDNAVRIYGTAGWMLLTSPYVLEYSDKKPETILHRAGSEPERILIRSRKDLYTYEAEAFAQAAEAGEKEVRGMTPEDTLGNMSALDQWRAAIGLRYSADAPR